MVNASIPKKQKTKPKAAKAAKAAPPKRKAATVKKNIVDELLKNITTINMLRLPPQKAPRARKMYDLAARKNTIQPERLQAAHRLRKYMGLPNKR